MVLCTSHHHLLLPKYWKLIMGNQSRAQTKCIGTFQHSLTQKIKFCCSTNWGFYTNYEASCSNQTSHSTSPSNQPKQQLFQASRPQRTLCGRYSVRNNRLLPTGTYLFKFRFLFVQQTFQYYYPSVYQAKIVIDTASGNSKG